MTIPMIRSDATMTATATATPTDTMLETPVAVPEPRDAGVVDVVAGHSWDDLVAQVREAGLYPTQEQAERVTRAVLAALGEQVVGDERVDLARALPEEAARIVAAQVPAHRPPAAAEFVDELSRRLPNATQATARWDTTSVLGVLPGLVGDDLTHRLLAQLPAGYALLFGQAELSRAV
ncbi:DUF2267 domain-containing protein [Streptomyces abyssomicinicus]|uniref:DUF2267 domain-containing protein n=1 Tax=Streptomyces abyssomicinicus TaxID=574929 RepID=UPI00350E3CB1